MSNPLLDTTSLAAFRRHQSPSTSSRRSNKLIAEQRSRKLNELLESTPDPDFDSLGCAPRGHGARVVPCLVSCQPPAGRARFSREWRDAYNAALPILTEYGTEISQNGRLQQAYARMSTGTLPPDDERGQAQHGQHRRCGIFAWRAWTCRRSKKRVSRTSCRRSPAAQADFDHNIQDASDAWTLHVQNTIAA